MTVLLSSHLLDEVERVCDGAVILGDGRVIASGALDDLRARVGGWLVEVEQGADRLAAALAAAGAAVTDEGRRLRVEGIASADPVRDAVAGLGLALVRLQRRRLSLEDVFLEAGMFDRPGVDGDETAGDAAGAAANASAGASARAPAATPS
jgi:ABC-2 type transport system ATP-binding protein